MNKIKHCIFLGFLLVLQTLIGCADRAPVNNNGAGVSSDITTESDETPSRKRARIRLELAVGYFQQGQANVALDEVKQSIAIDPNFVAAYNLRGLIYLRLNDFALAEESFRRALAIDGRDSAVAHNYGWMLCQQSRYAESFQWFSRAMANPTYTDQAKTLMTQGICQQRAGQVAEAERTLLQAYEIDAGNPVIGYNLARLLFDRGDLSRAQFYIRRLNNTDLANAESLWLGIKIEKKMNNEQALSQLVDQLRKRFMKSKEIGYYDKGLFNE